MLESQKSACSSGTLGWIEGVIRRQEIDYLE